MSRTLKATYSFALDGGNGVILLRGAQSHSFEVYWTWSLVVTEPVDGTYTDIDIGVVSNTGIVRTGVPKVTLNQPAPDMQWNVVQLYVPLHFGVTEPWCISVNGGSITTGAFVLLVQADRP